MTPAQVQIVQDTFPLIGEMLEPMTQLFYGRLFQMAPQLRPMFHGDMGRQGHKFAEMLTALVTGLPNLEQQAPALRAIGARHAGYGVRPEHYAIVSQALLWAIGQTLEGDLAGETKAAWSALISEVAVMMQAG